MLPDGWHPRLDAAAYHADPRLSYSTLKLMRRSAAHALERLAQGPPPGDVDHEDVADGDVLRARGVP